MPKVAFYFPSCLGLSAEARQTCDVASIIASSMFSPLDGNSLAETGSPYTATSAGTFGDLRESPLFAVIPIVLF